MYIDQGSFYKRRSLPFRCPSASNLAGQKVRSYSTHFSEGIPLRISALQAANISASSAREAADWLQRLHELCGPHAEVEDFAHWFQPEETRLRKLAGL